MARGSRLSAASVRRIDKSVNLSENAPRLTVGSERVERNDGKLWISIRNDAGETIPAYSVVRLNDVEIIADQEVHKAFKPSTSFGLSYAITSAIPITTSDKYGLANAGPYFLAKYDTGTPAVDEVWGGKPGQFTLSKGYPGFVVMGIHDSANKLVWVRPQEIDKLIGKTDGAIAAISTDTPGSGTVSIYYFNGTSLVDTTWNVTAYNMAAEVASGSYVQMKLIGGKWWIDVENCG